MVDETARYARALEWLGKASALLYRRILRASRRVRQFLKDLRPEGTLVCILLVLLWVGFFATGATVSSKQLLKCLSPSSPLYVPVAAVTYIYSNLAFLAFISGALGGYLSRMSLKSRAAELGVEVRQLFKPEETENFLFQMEPPILSALRSFAAYLLTLTGISIIVSGNVDDPSGNLYGDASQYIRLAGLISVAGFAVGRDPTKFYGVLDRFSLTGGDGGPGGKRQG